MQKTMSIPGIQSVSASADILWMVTEYTYDRGGNLKPTLARMFKEIPGTGTGDLFNTMPAYVAPAPGGSITDPSVNQYLHRMYSAQFYSGRRASVPIQISWDSAISIQNTFGSTTYEIHSTDTKITVLDYTNLSGENVQLVTNLATRTLTEGVDWTAATSNNATAISLNSAVNALAEVSSTVSANEITITPATGYSLERLLTNAASTDLDIYSSNQRSLLSIPLAKGLNRIDIIIYNHTANNPLGIHVDMSQITYAFASQLLPRYATGRLKFTTTGNADWQDSASSPDTHIGNAEGCNFLVRKAQVHLWEVFDTASPGYATTIQNIDYRIKGQESTGYPDAVESSGNGFVIQYKLPNDGNSYRTYLDWTAYGISLGS